MTVRGILSAALVLAAASAASAATITIDLDTANEANWQYGANGANGSFGPAFDVNGAGVGPQNGALFADNGSPVWQARFLFNLPGNATNVTLRITSIGVDDRAVFRLNGNDLPGANDTIFGSGPGQHDFGDGAGLVPFFFDGTPNWNLADPVDLVVTAGFFIGGVNTLIGFVNNNGGGFPGDGLGGFNPTALVLTGSVTYTVPDDGQVPAPASLALLGAALAGLGWMRQRR